MVIAIYLGWIRHNASGGVESFTRNILDGFSSISDNNGYVLICSSDNKESFAKYSKDSRFTIVDSGCETRNLKKTLWFESFALDKMVSKYGADVCFVPCYRIPYIKKKNKYVAVIHDLQAFHFPDNFGIKRRLWLQGGAKRTVQIADKVIAISNFVKQDIISKIKCDADKIEVILNPILPSVEVEDFEITKKELGVDIDNYLYTISALAKNKNLITLLRLVKLLNETRPQGIATKLVVSGIGLHNKDADNIDAQTLFNFIQKNSLTGNVVFTGFVSNERRNSLIKNSQFFLFPSVFEGFGMPVVEALEIGSRVITTSSTSIPEVSQNEAVYIDNYYNENEWLEAMIKHQNDPKQQYIFPQYDSKYVAREYLRVIKSVVLTK